MTYSCLNPDSFQLTEAFSESEMNSDSSILRGSASLRAKRHMRSVNLRLEPESLFNSTDDTTDYNEECGPLTSMLFRTPFGAQPFINDPFQLSARGPLTSLMLSGGLRTPGLTPRVQSLLASSGLFELPASFSLPTQVCEPCKGSLNANNDEIESKDFERAPDWPVPKTICSTEEEASRSIGNAAFDRSELHRISQPLASEPALQLFELERSANLPVKKPRGKKRRRAVRFKEKLEQMGHDSDAAQLFFCPFVNCCLSDIGLGGAKDFVKHVEQKHLRVKQICYWCHKEFSRSDALIRHIRSLHSRKERVLLLAPREAACQQLLECGFVANNSSFMDAIQRYHAAMLIRGSELERDDEDSSCAESDKEESSTKRSKAKHRTNRVKEARADTNSTDKNSTDTNSIDTNSTDTNSIATSFTDTSSADTSKELRTVVDEITGSHTFETLRSQGMIEAESNSRLNLLLIADANRDHMRCMLIGKPETLLEGCNHYS